MILLAGLGNPGADHARQRHNIGFMALDRIADRPGFTPWRARFQGEVSEGRLGGEKALLLKPLTYMNRSGQAVGEAMRYYKLAPADVTIFHDELDLAPGKVRIKTGGGHAGHNGLRSIGEHIGADFQRVRLGIGHPGDKARVTGHVLGDFAKADREWLDPLLDALADGADDLARGDTGAVTRKIAEARPPEAKPAMASDRPAPPKPSDAGDRAKSDTPSPFARLAGLFRNDR